MKRRLGWLVRPVGPATWDGLVRASGVVGVLAILLSTVVPPVADLALLFTVTLFLNGPYGALLPVAQEPVLMVFARLHPPVTVAAVATISVTAVEYLNYRLFAAAIHSNALTGLRDARWARRVVRWFGVRPFPTVALVSLTPIPFWLVRVVAAAARYRTSRFLAANAVGRFLRFWFYASIGLVIPLTSGQLLAAGAVLTLALGALAWRRRWAAVCAAEATATAEVTPLQAAGPRVATGR